MLDLDLIFGPDPPKPAQPVVAPIVPEVQAASVSVDTLVPSYPDDFPREVRELMALEFGGSPGDYRVWCPRPIVEMVPVALRETWEERAAIMQFDGGLSRDEAERRAWRDALFQSKGWKRR